MSTLSLLFKLLSKYPFQKDNKQKYADQKSRGYDMIIYVENAQKFTKILLGFLTSEFTKFGGYKINTWKSVAFSNAVYYHSI